jgi:hypothetical protein
MRRCGRFVRRLSDLGDGFGAADLVGKPDHFFDRQDEDLAVADGTAGAGAGNLGDRLHGAVEEIFVDRDFERDFAEQFGLRASGFRLGLAKLLAVAESVANGHPLHADFGERLLNGLEFCGLDEGEDHAHG